MIDPSNVLIRCPNGHDLQAAKPDLLKPLACPVCNVTFTPTAPTEAGASQTPPTDAAGTPTPTTLTYGPPGLGHPISYPAYTNWMLGLWIAFFACNAIGQLWQLANPQSVDPNNFPDPGLAMAALFISCFKMMGGMAAFVLQLMWIYRIHQDALRARNYRAVAPGLAIGLSFVPLFNLIWTAWTMKRLAGFAASGADEGEGNEDSVGNNRGDSEAVRAAGLCLAAGIAFLLMTCISWSFMGAALMDVARESQLAGAQGIDQQRMTQQMMDNVPTAIQILLPLVSVAGVLIYARAVRRLEASLYPFLGAPGR